MATTGFWNLNAMKTYFHTCFNSPCSLVTKAPSSFQMIPNHLNVGLLFLEINQTTGQFCADVACISILLVCRHEMNWIVSNKCMHCRGLCEHGEWGAIAQEIKTTGTFVGTLSPKGHIKTFSLHFMKSIPHIISLLIANLIINQTYW